MPRRPKAPDGAAPLPAERPAELPEDVWNLGRRLGNIALAGNLIEVGNGVRPADPHEVYGLLDASRKLEDAAFRKYTKLRQGIGGQLANAEREYREHRDRTARLVRTLDDPAALVNGASENGTDRETA
jgi:hypothetical protein